MKKFILWGTLLSMFFLMAFGSATAALGACLGCPDWPLCYGSLLPPEQRFALLEYTHRVLAALTSIFVAGALLLSFKEYRGTSLLKAGFLLVGLLVAQIVIGGITVLMRMPFWVSMAHALFALLTLLTATFMIKRADSPEKPFELSGTPDGKRNFVLLLLLLFQILLGTAVRKLQAGFACGQDVFLCLGQPWSGDVLVQVLHRLTGYFIFALSLYFTFVSEGRRWFAFVSLIVFLTGLFGALSAYSMLSPTMVTTHYSLAVLTMLMLFWRSTS